MNDSYSGKNGKVKVMYVRSEDKNDSRSNNKRPSGKGRDQGQSRRNNERSSHSPRVTERERSPWKTVSRPESDSLAPEHNGISGKSQIDHEQLRRQRMEETRIYGENACQAMFKNRSEAIVRAWFVESVTPRFRNALKWMAANRKAYHVVDEAELTKVSGTEHHGGVCFLIKKRNGLDVETYLKDAPVKDCVLALEDVGNPHNIGAIMRSCAHFGVRGVILQDVALLESGAAIRTAEGGAEHIKGIDADSLTTTLNKFRKAGYTIVTTSSHKGSTNLAKAELPEKMVLVLGQERDGLSDSAWEHGDMSLFVGGTGLVESLNVSVATGIMLAEWWRQNKA
ncbi:tRNA/rRNA methyltransferase [Photorhabdus heterorhabditis]|uniref:Methyltransferase n=1 Tax=Photorhabdus heterorhabditis TaxID=880156 RepID=A0A5B0WW52_9GAMM|nr:tRNA/rRNA methyltransferase [Photorhabdus heterorhabditis]KAA1190727.1 tRNA/rRNA methyltransferase [Photorhabdus heterorhabditis]KOY63060.1 methyltransferase [Photorhabdus heterorhabditis]MBS9442086.1 tRNA/rRNA methyltransferase [Photorhabdus heterorhabditis]